MEIKDVTFDDILKNGPEWGISLLRSAIGQELNDFDRRMRALTSIRIREQNQSKIEDLLILLQYREQKK